MKIIIILIGIMFSMPSFSQVNLEELIQFKTDSNWVCKEKKLSNGNIDKVYWDSVIIEGVKKNVNMGWETISPEGIVLERFRRDSLKKTYINAICDDKGNCISVNICETDYCLQLHFRPEGGIAYINNYSRGKKDGYQLRINDEGVIDERHLYRDGVSVDNKER